MFKTILNIVFFTWSKISCFFTTHLWMRCMNRGAIFLQTSLASKKNDVAQPQSWYLLDQIQLNITLVMVEQTYSCWLVLMSSCHCERNNQNRALPLKRLFSSIFLMTSFAIPASSLCHEHCDLGVWGGSLLGLLLKAAYPWWCLVSGLSILASSSQMSGSIFCPQSITADMEGGHGTSFLKSNSTKKTIGNPWERSGIQNQWCGTLLYQSDPREPPKSFVQWQEIIDK